MSRFKVGDKVQIRKDSNYYMNGFDSNPKDTNGDVCDVYGDALMGIKVMWPAGLTNAYSEHDLIHAVDVVQPTTYTEEHTGGSSSYYTVKVESPTTPYKLPYEAECNDIIEALNMTFAEANNFKATWRTAAARQGKKKKGNDAVYDAEKCVFFSGRMLVKAKKEADV